MKTLWKLSTGDESSFLALTIVVRETSEVDGALISLNLFKSALGKVGVLMVDVVIVVDEDEELKLVGKFTLLRFPT